MDEENHDEHGDHLISARELNAFKMHIRTAKNRTDAVEIIRWHELSDADFVDVFPELAKRLRELPDAPP